MIKNLSKYITSKESVEYIITNIIEYIEIWEENLQIDFTDSIFDLFSKSQVIGTDLIYQSFSKLFNKLIKFFMKMILINDKNVTISMNIRVMIISYP